MLQDMLHAFCPPFFRTLSLNKTGLWTFACDTVEPLLRGHPSDRGKYPLNREDRHLSSGVF